MAREGISTISTYQGRILRDETSMHRFLSIVGVSVTSMCREVDLMRCLREEVVPVLRTYPSVRIWMVGCATGEAVYSLAIMLQEEGLLRRASIYATDLNEGALAVARAGASPLDPERTHDDRYEAAGARGQLSDHYAITAQTHSFHRSLHPDVT